MPPGWLPGSAQIGFNPTGPQVGALGPGTNYLSVTPAGSTEPLAFSIDVPNSVPFTSVQLYLFLNSYQSVAWVLLDNGGLVSSEHDAGQAGALGVCGCQPVVASR